MNIFEEPAKTESFHRNAAKATKRDFLSRIFTAFAALL
jgi:hypothetical protein